MVCCELKHRSLVLSPAMAMGLNNSMTLIIPSNSCIARSHSATEQPPSKNRLVIYHSSASTDIFFPPRRKSFMNDVWGSTTVCVYPLKSHTKHSQSHPKPSTNITSDTTGACLSALPWSWFCLMRSSISFQIMISLVMVCTDSQLDLLTVIVGTRVSDVKSFPIFVQVALMISSRTLFGKNLYTPCAVKACVKQ